MEQTTELTGAAKMRETLGKFKEVALACDAVALPDDVRRALPFMRKAMDRVTRLYLFQQDESLPQVWDQVRSGADETKKAFFELFKGPWDPFGEHKSLAPELPDRRPGCAFYPADLTKEEFQKHLEAASEPEKAALTDTYTVVRRQGQGLRAIPYHEYYKDHLLAIADDMRQAASHLEHNELRRYVMGRAQGLLNGEHKQTDADWVRLENPPLEWVIGPFEVYDDGLLGIKASYESFLLATDDARKAVLDEIERNLSSLSRAFPLPAGAKSAVGGAAPVVVAHQLYSAGEAARGVMASAFNLPNDPWVRGKVGWKQIMIYNMMRAKFENCTTPISRQIIEGGQSPDFEPYFYFVLLHEVSHGLGPAYRAGGEEVAKSLGKHYTTIEEAKADTGSLFLLLKLAGRHGIPQFPREKLLKSYLAGLFRSMRFGVGEAHGGANVIQFNWFKKNGVIKDAPGGRFAADPSRLEEAAAGLLDRLCLLEASASEAEAKAFIDQHGVAGDDIKKALASLSAIPTDIRVSTPPLG